MMRFHKMTLHTDARSRAIYRARGWGKTHSNVFISIISPAGVSVRTHTNCFSIAYRVAALRDDTPIFLYIDVR